MNSSVTTEKEGCQAETLANQFGDRQVPAKRVAEVSAQQDIPDPHEILFHGASVQSVDAAQVFDFMGFEVFAILVCLLHQPVHEVSRRQDNDKE